MPLYETFKVTAVDGEDAYSEKGITSSEAEKKKVVAMYPDDTMTVSNLLGALEREKRINFNIKILAAEASKRVSVDVDIPLGHTFYPGYHAGTADAGDKYVVIEYEIVG